MTKAITVSNASKAPKTSKDIAVTVGAGMWPEQNTEWVAALKEAATAVVTGKAMATEGKAKGATALAVMVAAFASDDVAAHPWAFDILGKGDAVHTYVSCTGTNELGNDDLAWKLNGKGAISKTAQTAYKTAFQLEFFNREPNASIWTTASNAIAIARAIRLEGMTALVENCELKLTGGTTEKAEAMRDAKSLAALAKVAKDETGSKRAAPSNDKAQDEGRAATPEEIFSAALRLVEGVKKGDVALSSAALSYARRIAVLVAADNGADFDD